MKYQNPVISGFNPDPSICRVGEDYYLVTSSFEYFPGLPIYHSRDLVNWKQINNCIQRPEEFPLSHVKDSGGVWAPTIRFYGGRFYVTATLEQYGNFIVSAREPAGEWSAPVWVPVGGIDPSLFFEEGKAYYCTNYSLHPGREEITLEEIEIQTGELLTEPEAIWSGIGGGFLEAPHIYHIGEWYYLLTAEGGTNYNHMITVARSRSIRGPYESCPFNPILTNVHDTSKEVQCAGHGDLFQDHNGNWWMIHLAIRLCRRTMTNLGRETFLTPVTWKEDWPVVAGGSFGEPVVFRKAELNPEGPLWAAKQEKPEWKLDLTCQKWEPEIVHLRTPVVDNYIRKPEGLFIKPTTVKIESQSNPSVLLLRQRDFDCEMQTRFHFHTCREGDEAGIVVMLSSLFHYRMFLKRVEDRDYLMLEKCAEDMRQQVFCQEVRLEDDTDIRMEVRADKEKYSFYFSVGDTPYEYAGSGSTRFLCVEIAGKCFTGTVMGLYTCCEQETEAVLQVREWRMQ